MTYNGEGGIMKKLKILAATVAAIGVLFAFAACGTETVEHHYKETVIDPTCTEQGYTIYECTDEGCGHTYIGNYKSALGHEYEDNFCVRCGLFDKSAPYTEGLDFTPVYEKNGTTVASYTVSGSDNATPKNYLKLRETYESKPVKCIGAEVFSGCVGLLAVSLPNAVEVIEENAFSGCTAIGELYLGTSSSPRLNTLEDGAFANCTSLTDVVVPNSVKRIGLGAFEGCSALESMSAPFATGKLTEVVADGEDEPKTVTEYLHFGYAFGAEEHTLNAQAVPASLKSIKVTGNLAIKENGFREFPIEAVETGAVSTVGENAFKDCAALKSAKLGAGVVTVGSGAFDGCVKLTEIDMDKSVSQIGGNAFRGCVTLETAEIPSDAASIGLGAFYGCSALKSLTMPYAAGELGSYKNFGYIFGDDGNYQNSVVPASLKSVKIVGKSSIVADAFSGCSAIENISVDGTVKSIGGNAFKNCAALESAVLGVGVTTVGDEAFGGCAALAELELGKGIKSVGVGAFSGCTALKTVRYNGTIAEFGATHYADKYSSPLAYSAELIIDGVSVKYH